MPGVLLFFFVRVVDDTWIEREQFVITAAIEGQGTDLTFVNQARGAFACVLYLCRSFSHNDLFRAFTKF